MTYKYITKIVYVGNHIFFVNDSEYTTYDDLINDENYINYKVILTMFMRKLKLLKLIHKSEKELHNTEVYKARFKPMNFDYQFLYPHTMKIHNISPVTPMNLFGNGPTYIRKLVNSDDSTINKIMTEIHNNRKNGKNKLY